MKRICLMFVMFFMLVSCGNKGVELEKKYVVETVTQKNRR